MLTWPPTAATILLLWPILTALISLFYNALDGIPRVHAVLALLVKAGVDLPAILDALKRLLSGQTVQTQRAAKVAQDIVKAAAVVLALGLLGATQSACISVTPTVPETPANKAQIATCESIATQHNAFVFTGVGTGAIAGGLSASSLAFSGNQGAQTGLAIASAGTAVIAAVAAGGAGLTGSAFSSDRCTDVTTPLPMKPNPAGKNGWPADWAPPRLSESVESADGVVSATAGAR